MPTVLEKTWQCDVNRFQNPNNNTVDSEKRCLWYMKAALKGEVGSFSSGLWTCAGSSDSSTGAMDATDRWGSSFSAGAIVNNNNGSPHSWIVLQHPTLSWQICLDFNTAGAAYQCSFIYAKTAFTGGDASNRPTSTDEVTLSAWTQLQFHPNTGDFRMNVALATDGAFVMAGVGQGDGYCSFGWIFQIPADTKSGDGYPAVMYVRHNTGGGGAWDRGVLGQNVISWAGRNATGSTVVTPAILVPYAAAFPFDSFTIDQQCGLITDLPCFIGVTNPGNQTLKGRLIDIRWGPSALAASFPEPNSLTPTTILLGTLWLPFNKNLNL